MLWLCLRLLPDARPDRAALEGVAAWACQFTDRLTLVGREHGGMPFCALLAEIEGSLALFGGLVELRARLLNSFAGLGYAHVCAIAPTPAAAEAFALAGDEAPVTQLAQLPARLARLPLAVLNLPARVLEKLHGVGLRTAGDCLALPHDQLARRFGAATVRYLRQLDGQAPDPRSLYVLPPGYQRRFEFEGAVDSVESLGFVLKRLLLELQGVLLARDTAVAKLALELEHEDAPASVIELALTTPRRDAQQLLGLFRERLERWSAPPAVAMVLRVVAFAEAVAGQHDLFDERVQRRAAAQDLIEQLLARLGEGAVQGIALCADHRPEKSFTAIAPRAPASGEGVAHEVEAAHPFWLLREPRPLREPPPRVTTAQRIETGWWDEAGVARDYFVAETGAGERLWIFYERGAWYLHGIWS